MRDIWTAPMMRTGDLEPFPAPAIRFWEFFVSVWSQDNLGTTVGSDLSPLLRMVIQSIVRDAVVAQKIIKSVVIPVGAIAMYVLAGLVTQRTWARYTAAFVFALNPILAAAPGGPLSLLLATAPLPAWGLASLLWLRFSRWSLLRYLLPMALWSVFGINALVLSIGLSGALLFAAMTSVPRRKLVAVFALVAGIHLFVFLVLDLPKFISFTPGAEHIASVNTDAFVRDVQATHVAATPDRLLRLAGNAGAGMWVLGYNNDPHSARWTVLGWALTALAGLALWTPRGQNRRAIVGAFALLTAGVTLFLWFTSLGTLLPVFERFNALFVFRNPGKLMILLSLGLSVLAGAGAAVLQDRLRTERRRVRRWALPTITSAAYLAYMWPVFLGDLGTSILMDTYDATVLVPARYASPVAWLQARERDEGFFRVLWLPSDPDTRLALRRSVANQFSAQPGAEIYGQGNAGALALDARRSAARRRGRRPAACARFHALRGRRSRRSEREAACGR